MNRLKQGIDIWYNSTTEGPASFLLSFLPSALPDLLTSPCTASLYSNLEVARGRTPS
jgi:hypothetical protein